MGTEKYSRLNYEETTDVFERYRMLLRCLEAGINQKGGRTHDHHCAMPACERLLGILSTHYVFQTCFAWLELNVPVVESVNSMAAQLLDFHLPLPNARDDQVFPLIPATRVFPELGRVVEVGIVSF